MLLHHKVFEDMNIQQNSVSTYFKVKLTKLVLNKTLKFIIIRNR